MIGVTFCIHPRCSASLFYFPVLVVLNIKSFEGIKCLESILPVYFRIQGLISFYSGFRDIQKRVGSGRSSILGHVRNNKNCNDSGGEIFGLKI